jgi:hypothetical protein
MEVRGRNTLTGWFAGVFENIAPVAVRWVENVAIITTFSNYLAIFCY